MTVSQVVRKVAADIPFYRNSGGGVTFSGGEPLDQPAFLRELLKECKALGIHRAVETCGAVDFSAFQEIEPLVDLFLYDLKAADGEFHRRLTGKDNRQILENLRELLRTSPGKVLVRIPIVPGYTDPPENIEALAVLASELGLSAVHLELYHEFGAEKYGELGRAYVPQVNLAQCTLGAYGWVAQAFGQKGVVAEWE